MNTEGIKTPDGRVFSPLSAGEKRAVGIAGWVAFAGALLVYWLTVAPSASYWDCPEYLLTAVRLEVGHPPGNPFWTLFHRMVTMFVDSAHAALAVNMASGLFTALAVLMLSRMVCFLSLRILRCRCGRAGMFAAVVGGVCGSLMFAWCDSAWFSAVEAEVYAMSVFFTALTLWLMLRWCLMPPGPGASRMLLLIVYLTGLSLGVHQLNLLSLPVLALIYLWRRSRGRIPSLKVWGGLIVSCLVIVLILKGMMPGTVWTAALSELFAVNACRLPFHSGELIYLLLLSLSAVAAVAFARCDSSSLALRVGSSLSLLLLLLLSGLFFPAVSPWLTLGLGVFAVWWLLWSPWRPSRHKVLMGIWSVALLLIGYSSLLLIPIRAAASPYVNSGFASDAFGLYSYVEREQYGGAPLLYGRTPYSRPMALEEFGPDSVPSYSRIALKKGHPVWLRALPGGKIAPRSGFVTAKDSAAAESRLNSASDSYVLADYRFNQITTPELDMWLPRITSGNPSDLDAYASWIGMDTSNMKRVAVSDAFDAEGNPVNRRNALGERVQGWSHRPTYLQNLQFFLGYQTYYMYLRYLLWNFAGRQNDFVSSGEADHGNFLTGIPVADDLMLGSQELLPPEAGDDNAGRNVYWMLPLLLCVIGMVALTRSGRPGRRASFAILMLFLLTGVAIVVYLNQTVGEPRERDYSFLGSFFAFAAWGGVGAAWTVGLFRRRIFRICAAVGVLAVPSIMLARNYDDHDRSGRHAATDFAVNTLESLPPDAILFVDGDNYTFPMWYVQEVLGVRRDVTVVSLSYLTLPRYVLSLLQPGEEGRPVEMHAGVSDLFYGRYAFCRFPAFSADSVELPADTFFNLLYTSDTPKPILPSSRMYIVSEGDTLHIDLRAASAGSSMLGQRQLAILDIAASSLTSPHPRPLCWISQLPERQYSGLSGFTTPDLYVRILRPEASPNPSSALSRLADIRWGGFNAGRRPYADPTVRSMVSAQRIALIREGRRWFEAGRPDIALRYAYAVLDSLPSESSPYGYAPIEGKTAWDGLELSSLLRDAGDAAGDPVAIKRGNEILREEKNKIEAWRRWRNSLPPHLRPAVSSRTLRLLNLNPDSI